MAWILSLQRMSRNGAEAVKGLEGDVKSHLHLTLRRWDNRMFKKGSMVTLV